MRVMGVMIGGIVTVVVAVAFAVEKCRKSGQKADLMI